MSTEIDRQVFGVGDRGEVVVIHYSNRYIVRMGALTITETASKRDADTVARTLVR